PPVAPPPAAAAAAPAPVARPATRAGLPPRASPAARKRAAELGVDLDALAAATGGAPISIADVQRAAAAPSPAPAAAAPPTPVVAAPSPEAAMRTAIAAAMARSKREIPHYYLGTDIDVEHAQQW